MTSQEVCHFEETQKLICRVNMDGGIDDTTRSTNLVIGPTVRVSGD